MRPKIENAKKAALSLRNRGKFELHIIEVNCKIEANIIHFLLPINIIMQIPNFIINLCAYKVIKITAVADAEMVNPISL